MEDHEMTAKQNENMSGNTAVAEQEQPTQTPVQNADEETLTFVPAVDIFDTKAETRLVMDVPGVDKDGLDIAIEQDILTIKAEPASDQTVENARLVYAEYRVGNYQRSFSLSEKVDKENIKAIVKDGVLEVTLPKTEPVTKKITVSGS